MQKKVDYSKDTFKNSQLAVFLIQSIYLHLTYFAHI